MARSKRYSLKMMFLDLFLILITGGFWLIVILLREIYYHQ